MMDEASTKRFTAADVAQLATRAQNQVAFEVDHPESTQNILLVSGQQEYQLIDLMKLLRVYTAVFNSDNPNFPFTFKQELIATNIGTLEGDVIQRYDNSSGIVPQTSKYIAQQPELYPYAGGPNNARGFGNNSCEPYPTNMPWSSCNSRPSYYLRGGYIGVVPIPLQSNPPTYLMIDCTPAPPALVNTTDNSIYPDIFLEAIVWKMIEYASYSDHNSAQMQAAQMYQNEVTMKINPWIQRLQATRPKTMVPITKRTYFRRGGIR